MDFFDFTEKHESPYQILLTAASLIPLSHYFLGFLFVCLVFLYNFLEIHVLRDLFTGFRGQAVCLTFNSSSEVYHEVVSKCRILRGRYLSTPWLSSPHLQTSFLSFFGRPPAFNYRRQLFHTSDGGPMALDWMMNFNVPEASFQVQDASTKDDKTPIVLVIPGLTSDSASASDRFYNAGWTEDIRKVIDNLHHRYPEAPLFVVGTSIGANILVKYLGEEGINTPIVGAAAVCSPWDLLICDRFINRRTVQKFYDKALISGLKGYAQLHQPVLSRLADWEGILKSRSVRDFDNYATRVLGKFETVDAYYRHSSSTSFVGNVMVPLLCISALDDPVCTREAIPSDECRANKNVVLATTQHGGHLAYFEGISATSIWWVRAVHEFFSVLHSSSLIHRKKEAEMQSSHLITPQESSIDQGPFVSITEDGMVSATGNAQTNVQDVNNDPIVQSEKGGNIISETQESDRVTGERTHLTDDPPQTQVQDINDIITPVRRYVDQLSRHSRKSIWLLAYIAIVTTWPLVGSALTLFFKKNSITSYQESCEGDRIPGW